MIMFNNNLRIFIKGGTCPPPFFHCVHDQSTVDSQVIHRRDIQSYQNFS